LRSHAGSTASNFKVIKKTTALIDLTPEENNIFANFNDTTRNEIRKAERNNKLVFKSEDNNFSTLYNLYKEFEFSQKRIPISIKDFKQYTFFSAHYDEEPISAISIVSGQKYLRIRSIFSKRLKTDSKDLYKVISNASRAVVWEICKWGRKNGFKSLDMASVNLSNPETASIARFKMTFGGDLGQEYTYLYESKVFKLFKFLVSINHFFRKLVRKVHK